MVKFTKSIFINRSRQDVFDFLSNPENLSKWQPAIVSAEWTSNGIPAIGSTYKTLIKMAGAKSEGQFKITHWDPPNRYGYETIKIPFPIKSIELLVTLEAKDSGTQLTFEANLATLAILKFAEGMLGKQAEKQDGGNIESARRLLETG